MTNVLLAKIAFFALNAVLAFNFLGLTKTAFGQEFSPAIRAAIPDVEKKMRSPRVEERIEVLEQLVVRVKASDVIALELQYENLPATDYSSVIKSLFEFDLSKVEEKTASRMWWRINFLVAKFQLKEFGKTLADYLTKINAPQQAEILRTLKKINAVETASDIFPFAGDKNYVQREALSALIEFRSKLAVSVLVPMLRDKEHLKRYSAISSLVKIGASEAAPEVVKLLEDENANNRYWALDALAKFNARQYAPQIWKLVGGEQTRQTEDYAIAVLASFGDKRAVPLIVERTISKDLNKVYTELFNKIVELKATAIVPAYIKLLENDQEYLIPEGMDSHVRGTAMNVLGRLKARDAIPILRKYARGEKGNKFLQSGAAIILGEMNAREAVNDLLPLLDKTATENDAYDAAQVAIALAKIGEPRTWKRLIDFAASPNCYYGSLIIIELNRHLDPELWKKAEEKKVSRQYIVSIKEVSEIYSRETGIKIVLHFEPGKDVSKRQPLAPPLKDTHGYPWVNSGDTNLIKALRDIPDSISNGTLPQNFTFIFDDKQIHILSIDKALRWWRENILMKTEKLNART